MIFAFYIKRVAKVPRAEFLPQYSTSPVRNALRDSVFTHTHTHTHTDRPTDIQTERQKDREREREREDENQ